MTFMLKLNNELIESFIPEDVKTSLYYLEYRKDLILKHIVNPLHRYNPDANIIYDPIYPEVEYKTELINYIICKYDFLLSDKIRGCYRIDMLDLGSYLILKFKEVKR